MKILIDTDVLLDVVFQRIPHAADSGRVLDWAESHPGTAAVAWHSLSNLAYMIKGDPRRFLRELLGFTLVAPTSTDAARQALRLPLADLEDAFQVVAALRFGAERIVTRHIHDYKRSPIPAMTPAQFIAACGE